MKDEFYELLNLEEKELNNIHIKRIVLIIELVKIIISHFVLLSLYIRLLYRKMTK